MAARDAYRARILSVTPTVSVGAYHASDNIGGKITLSDVMVLDSGIAYLYGLCLTDAANQKKALEVVIFNADPAAATLTDHAAIAFSTDLAKVQARIAIAATDWATVGGAAIADVQCLSELEAASGNKLYVAIMAVDAPTYATAADLTIKFRFDRER